MNLFLLAKNSMQIAFYSSSVLSIQQVGYFWQLYQLWTMSKQKSRNNWTLADYGLSWGFIAAFTTLNNPLDVVRFRLQVMPLLVEQGHLNKLYRGCINCACRIYRHEGVRSFFKGNLSNLMRVVPSETLVWQLKQYFQRFFHYKQNLSNTQHVKYNTLIGISASLIVSLSLYPLEYIRQMLLNRTDRQGRSMWHYLKKTIINEGVSGMFKGAGIFSLGLVFFRGTYFGVYDSLKVKTNDQKCRWLASALASYLAIFSGYPIDTVRRRFVSCRGKYANTRECLRDILRTEGVRGLYFGWPMITLQSVSLATVFFFYDRLITDYDQAID